MNVARCHGSAAVVNVHITIGGGRLDDNIVANSFDLYDPKCDEWLQLAPMRKPRSTFTLKNMNGFLYAIGWRSIPERYDSWKMCWSEVDVRKCFAKNFKINRLKTFQIGSFKDSALITNAIEVDGELVGIMRNGQFGKVVFNENGDCSFVPLSKLKHHSLTMGKHVLCEN